MRRYQSSNAKVPRDSQAGLGNLVDDLRRQKGLCTRLSRRIALRQYFLWCSRNFTPQLSSWITGCEALNIQLLEIKGTKTEAMSSISALWPYQFVSLSPSQIEERRELLDLRGNYVHIFAALYLLILVVYARGRQDSTRSAKTDNGSNRAKQNMRPRPWMDSPPISGWGESRRQYLIILVWLTWTLALSAWKTGDGMFKLFLSITRDDMLQDPVSFIPFITISQRSKGCHIDFGVISQKKLMKSETPNGEYV